MFGSPWTTPEAWSFLEAVLASASFGILVETERHPEVLQVIIDEVPLLSGNILHDTHTATLMREHGIRQIYTRDTGFHRFKFLEVVDPLEP